MNHIVLIGRLTRDPELRYTQNGVAVATFDLAVPRQLKQDGQPEADFFKIVVWKKTAENCANYLKKGRLAAVEGRVQNRSYQTQDGQKRYITEVIANRVQFLEKNRTEEESAPPQTNTEDLGDINLDDLPF